MSRSKATKRRKVWVVDDESRGSQVFLSRQRAATWAAKGPRDGAGRHVVPFVELLPGDVVLSREDVKHALESLRAIEDGPQHLGHMLRLRLLLRGRR